MTYINDVASNALALQGACPGGGTVAGTTGFTAGTTNDFMQTQGQCTLIQTIGNMTGNSPTLQTRVEESTDGTTWTTVSGGSMAVYNGLTTAATTPVNACRVLTFQRTKRYLRTYDVMTGTGVLSILYSNVIVAQKQQV